MKYLTILMTGIDPFTNSASIGLYRWKWVAWLIGLWARLHYGGGLFVIWHIPERHPNRFNKKNTPWNSIQQIQECTKCESRWIWDGVFAPTWVWSKAPCFDCVCEAKAQGFDSPRKALGRVTVSVKGEVITAEAIPIPKQRQLGVPILPSGEPDCPECSNGMTHDQCRTGWKAVLQANLEAKAADGSLPKWRPPCNTCGSNCGQCGSSHCGICGVKAGYPHLGQCDQAMHAAYEATKCGLCGKYAAHFCLDNKVHGEQYSARNSYKKGEKDAMGDFM